MDARFTLAGAFAGRVRATGKADARGLLDVDLLRRGGAVVRLLSGVRRLAIRAIPPAGAAAAAHAGDHRVAASDRDDAGGLARCRASDNLHGSGRVGCERWGAARRLRHQARRTTIPNDRAAPG